MEAAISKNKTINREDGRGGLLVYSAVDTRPVLPTNAEIMYACGKVDHLMEMIDITRLRVIQENMGWIDTVVAASQSLDTLTPRTRQEVVNILLSGFGDICFVHDEKGSLTPVSILLLTEMLSHSDQILLYEKLGVPRDYAYPLTFHSLFYESSLGYTQPEYRHMGFNAHTRRLLYNSALYLNTVIVGNTCNPYAMRMLAGEGLVPLSHSEYTLATSLLSFCQYPDWFAGAKPVPTLEEVHWMSDSEVRELRRLLALRWVKGEEVDVESFPRGPVVFVSMLARNRFLRNPSKSEYERALPHISMEIIERRLKRIIADHSLTFQSTHRIGEDPDISAMDAFLHQALYQVSLERSSMKTDP